MDDREARVKELGLPAFRARQLSTHYFTHYTTDPADMTDLPADKREELAETFFPTLLTEVRRIETEDRQTIKFLWKLFDGVLVESVLMRYENRITLCVSSQAGCGMNCPFCATGQAGLTRNLSTAEIVDQIIAANRVIARSEEHTSELQSRGHLVCRLLLPLHSFPTRRSSDLNSLMGSWSSQC